MKTMLTAAAMTLIWATTAQAAPTEKTKVMIQSLSGSNDPTRATLALIGAWGVAEAGHEASVVLAGEAVFLLNDTVAASTVGVGLGDAKTWLERLQKHRIPIYYCGACGKARDVTAADLKAIGATAITAKDWGAMVAKVDRVVSY